MNHIEAWGKRKGKLVYPNIHAFMYFLNGEFFQNIKVVWKNNEKLKSWCIKIHNIIFNLNAVFILRPNLLKFYISLG